MNERGISYKAIAVNGHTLSLISFPSKLPTPLAAMTTPVQMTGSSLEENFVGTAQAKAN